MILKQLTKLVGNQWLTKQTKQQKILSLDRVLF